MNRLILFLIGIVLVGIAGFALVWFGVGRELQPVAARTLVELRDGKEQAVYERAAEAFRAGQDVGDLGAYWAWWREKLGTFVEILARRSVGARAQGAETHKTMTLELGFMKGKARMEFEFLDAEPEPLLVHLRISTLDEGLGAKEDREQLVGRVRDLFKRYDEEDWIGFYAGLSFDLQRTWRPRMIAAQMPAKFAAQGKVEDLRLVKSEDGPAGVVVQHFDVDYERATGTAEVSQRFDDGRWSIVGFVFGDAR